MIPKLGDEVLVECPLCDEFLPLDEHEIVRHYMARHRGSIREYQGHALCVGINLVSCWCGWRRIDVEAGLHTTRCLADHMRSQGGVLLHAKACLLGVGDA